MGRFSQLGSDLYSGRRSINFVGRKWLWYAVSGVILAVAVSGLLVRGLNLGIEFTGGAQFKVTVPASEADQDTADRLRDAVAGLGIDAAKSPIVTTSGEESVIVQTESLTDAESEEVVATIVSETGAPATDVSESSIGPSYGRDVAERSAIGLGIFLVLVVLFIWAYFREWKMSVAAIVALIHDVVITVGVYALSGFEVTPATVTGLLTILGFSLYDTVVVFDKVRENTKNLRQRRQTYADAANLALNQTLVRSINTSIVALIPVGVILYVSAVQLGASSLKDLALALFVGMAAGTYSSVFIATPLLVHLKSGETDVVLAEKRARARAKQVDPYASVPAFTDDMPVHDEPGATRLEVEEVDEEEDRAAAGQASRPQPTGLGRVAPPARGPVRPSAASRRQQPVRQPKSKRGK